eukprot:CAMPEP_0182870594 /NCGR_PEP_ID=MMETSP0034_2-20130328/10625_1 /TAXON_ID=156128 /ORGANISM="Nephroselmis pyriformis, Strain CCMP717" /LENGTH=66 /DNA_ID=CAMNT_0025003101 /DNA_START=113 /DNA_END=310 /DNA_ORIENTATION=+
MSVSSPALNTIQEDGDHQPAKRESLSGTSRETALNSRRRDAVPPLEKAHSLPVMSTKKSSSKKLLG